MYKIIHVDLFMFECMTSSLWHSLYKEMQSQYHLLAIYFSPAVLWGCSNVYRTY